MDKDLTANTMTVSGKDGKDGQIGITGKDGADGTVTTIIKTIGRNGTNGTDGTPGVNGTDGITRIVYQDGKDGDAGTTTHTVATLDDGLKFGANAPVVGKTVNPVGNKMNSTIKITGDGDKELDKYSGKNLLTSVEQDGDGNTTIHVLMDKNISADSMVVGQAGKMARMVTLASTVRMVPMASPPPLSAPKRDSLVKTGPLASPAWMARTSPASFTRTTRIK